MTTRKPPGWSRPRSRRRLLTAVAVTALATGLLTPLAASPATADNTTATEPAAGTASEVQPIPGLDVGEWSVTLLTGDTVHLSKDAEGRTSVTVDPTGRPDGYVPTFSSESSPEGTFVIPDDARPALDSGILDKKLFDVGHLAKQGFADDATRRVPLIVGYRGSVSQASLTSTAKALPATTGERSLPSIHGAAVQVNKTGADDFWTTLRGSLPGTGQARARTLAGGVAKVWLDDKVTVSLDESVPLIGAPEAWKSGLDGKGVTVAVLDTGIDATHPDVAGKVATSRSFIAGEEVADGHGHGTHVAATIAGTGAASGGARRGVAPGAQLAVGKVLNDAGRGSNSEIIAGMEWAVGEADADIVSMSLGGDPTDGTDPLSRAVDALSASTDTLFVIAAGNTGPGTSTVGAPGTAASALTVAATDKSDGLADFSSRGPRAGDLGLKPDIAAPGVSIVAARASGTSLGNPVDANHTSLNGTSMATPHVAGAAAILVQQHPDWSWSRLKSALMSTSKDAGHTAYEQGAGRLDVARATTQQVTATTANVDYGTLPFDQNQPVERKVAYTNDGDTDVTLTLSAGLNGADGPLDGRLTTDAPQVTVPAHATAETTVTVDPDGLAKGSYEGAVVATDDAGTRVAVPVGLQRAPQRVPLTVHLLGRDGKPADPQRSRITVASVDVPGVYLIPATDITHLGDSVYRMLVEPGTYDVSGLVGEPVRDGARPAQSWALQPQVTVPTSGTEVTLDASTAVPVEFDVPKPVNRHWVTGTLSTVRSTWDGSEITTGHMGLFGRWYVTPTRRVTNGTFLFSTQVTLSNPQLAMSVEKPRRTTLDAMQYGYGDHGLGVPVGEFHAFPEGTRRREVVDVGLGRPEDVAGLDLRGRIALKRLANDVGGGYWGCSLNAPSIQELKDAGAVGVLAYPDDAKPGCTVPALEGAGARLPLPVAQVVTSEGKRVKSLLDRGGPVTLRIDSNPDVDYTYQLLQYEEQRIPADLSYSYDKRSLSTVRSGYHRAGAPEIGWEAWNSYKPVEDVNFTTRFDFAFPSTRTEYFGGHYSDVLRIGLVVHPGADGDRRVQTVLARPTNTSVNWGTTPLTPGAPAVPASLPEGRDNLCSFCRQGDVLTAVFYGANSGGRTARALLNFDPDARMYRNGEELERVPTPYGTTLPTFPMSKEEATYRLEQSSAGNRNVWTFRSGARGSDTAPRGYLCLPDVTTGPCNPQPLVFVGYDMDDSLALDNTVRAGRSHSFDIVVNHHASKEKMPRIAGLKLSYSVDGGATWKSATVRGGRDGVYSTTLHYPALGRTSGAVSLRAEAWDAAGNRVVQTTTDAVRLR